MTLNLKEKDKVIAACLDEYNKLDPADRLEMSHFELADATPIQNSDAWLHFLTDPDVKRQRAEEIAVYKTAQRNKLIGKIIDNDRSTGTAQILGALTKEDEVDNLKTGPVCIYSYVPLDAREQLADNITAEDHDIFKEDE